MHMVFDVVPFDDMPRAVRAEHGVAGIEHIRVGVVAEGSDDLLGVVTRLIAL